MKKVLLILIPIVVVVAVGVGAFIAFASSDGRSKNPIKNIRQSIAKHDADNFYNMVDVDAVVDDAAEQILSAQINSNVDALAYSTQNFVTEYETLKPDFVAAAKSAIDEYISKGTVTFQPPLNSAQKFLNDSAVATCTIKTLSKPKFEGDTARAKVDFYNEGMNFYFELELILEKVGKSWKVTGVKGFENYVNGFNRTLRKKLEQINAPIRDEIKQTFNVKGFNANISEGDEYGFSQTLHLTVQADLNYSKPIAKVSGNIIIDGRDGREGVTPFSIDVAGSEQGVQTFEVDKVLNPFVREDANVMRHGLKRSALHIEITQIDFADGTTLKQLIELP